MQQIDACNGCGECCIAYPCDLAMVLIGNDSPCPALEDQGSGKFRCGLILHPSKYLNLGEYAQWKDDFMAAMFSHILGIGLGCCVNPKPQNIDQILRESIKHGLSAMLEAHREVALLGTGKMEVSDAVD